MSTFDEIAELVGLEEGNERWGVQPVRTNQGLIDAVAHVVAERDRFREYLEDCLLRVQATEADSEDEHAGCLRDPGDKLRELLGHTAR